MNKHAIPVRVVLTVTLLIAGLPSCKTPPKLRLTSVPEPIPGVAYPELVPARGAAPLKPLKQAFLFEQKQYKVAIDVNAAIVAAARATQKVVRMEQEIPRAEWAAGLQWALITDPAQTPLYDAILEKLRVIRRASRLDDDRYAELITQFVQSITYCNAPGQAAKYPIETIADGCGDCDDKSRLLVGLLRLERYDVALFVFREENHMAVGLRTDGDGFMGSGYDYIETTSSSYIGFPSYEYSDVKLSSTPEIIVIGSPGKQWGSSDQVAFLYDTLNEERDAAEGARSRLAKSKAESEALNAEYKQLAKALAAGKGVLEPEAYNKLVDKTNRAADRFNRSVDDHNALVERVNKSAEIVTYIFDHPDDRHGVYLWVKAQLN